MKTFITKILFALLKLISVFLLGIKPSKLVSSFIIIFTDSTYQDCITTGGFWIITLLGWLCATLYINHEITN